MKRILLICSGALLIGVTLLVGIIVQPDPVAPFNLSDYQSYLNYNSSKEIVEPIKNSEDAKIQAEILWTKVFDEKVAKTKKPYIVYHDFKNDAWLVEGTLPQNYMGGVPCMIATSGGKVLALWGSK